MGKYRTLLAGKNQIIIDDFFAQMNNYFDMISTSIRYDDMDRHIEIFAPEIFVVCLNDESRDEMNRIMELKRKLTRNEIPCVIIGTREDCETFQKIAVYMADLVLTKPITIEAIKDGILELMDNLEKERQERIALEETLAKIKEQARRKHVLVIDDDPMMLKLIKEHLHENYDVATAISGKIAFKFLETKKTDLILLDYEMSVQNGLEVLEELRKNDELSGIPVIFLTGMTDREKIQKVLMLKPQGYLLKPIDREKLLGTIEKFIG